MGHLIRSAWVILPHKNANESDELLAAMHRKDALLHAWRRAVFTRRIARRRIEPAILHWALRPGGAIFTRAKTRFEALV